MKEKEKVDKNELIFNKTRLGYKNKLSISHCKILYL